MQCFFFPKFGENFPQEFLTGKNFPQEFLTGKNFPRIVVGGKFSPDFIWSFKKGKLSATEVQKSGKGIVSKSSSSKNVSRDLMRKLERETNFPEVYTAEIDMWDSETAQKTKVAVHFLLIFEKVDLGPFFPGWDPYSLLTRHESALSASVRARTVSTMTPRDRD